MEEMKVIKTIVQYIVEYEGKTYRINKHGHVVSANGKKLININAQTRREIQHLSKFI